MSAGPQTGARENWAGPAVGPVVSTHLQGNRSSFSPAQMRTLRLGEVEVPQLAGAPGPALSPLLRDACSLSCGQTSRLAFVPLVNNPLGATYQPGMLPGLQSGAPAACPPRGRRTHGENSPSKLYKPFGFTLHTYARTHTHIHMHTCTCVHMHTHIHTQRHAHEHMDAHTHSHTDTHAHTHMDAHMYTCVRTFTHIHTCSHT